MAPKRQRDDGGDGDGANKKKWGPPNNKAPMIPADSQGFLVSCVTGKEALASREATQLLGQYVESTVPAAAAAKPAAGSDISALIADEVADLKSDDNKPLSWHKTNISGMLYVSLSRTSGTTPTKLVHAMATDIKATKQCKSRLCLRFIPVEHVCKADLEDIKKLAEKVVPAAFPARDEDAEPVTFAVEFEHRASKTMKRMDVINAFVDHVPKGYKVSLTDAQHTILVQLVKSCCTVAVVQNYKELQKFNIRELSGAGEGAAAAARAAEAKSRQGAAGGEASAAQQPPAAEEAAAEAGAAADAKSDAEAAAAAPAAEGSVAAADAPAVVAADAPAAAAAAATATAAEGATAAPTPEAGDAKAPADGAT